MTRNARSHGRKRADGGECPCRKAVEQIVAELREKAQQRNEKATSFFSTTTNHLGAMSAYNEAADLLEERVLHR